MQETTGTYARLIAALALCGALASAVTAEVILPTDLPAGAQFRLVFLTAGARDATSADIADYNAFVTQQAQLSTSELVRNANWRAIASTDAAYAVDNAELNLAVPVYNTHGELVVPGGQPSPLLTITHLAPIIWDQEGNEKPVIEQFPWTGCTQDGTPVFPGYGSYGLGSSEGASIVGAAADLGLGDVPNWVPGWLSNELAPLNTALPFYALSAPLTVPEPGAVCVLVLAGFVRRRPS